jgi:hypothetical protein
MKLLHTSARTKRTLMVTVAVTIAIGSVATYAAVAKKVTTKPIVVSLPPVATGAASNAAPPSVTVNKVAPPGPIAPPPAEKMSLGINLGPLAAWSNERAMGNLLSQSYWFLAAPGKAWVEMPKANLNADGWIVNLPTGYTATISLARPDAPFSTLPIKCTFEGTGAFQPYAGGMLKMNSVTKNSLSMTMTWNPDMAQGGYIILKATSPSDPIRNIDCRETTMPKDAYFAPKFIELVRQFKAVRFLDWQHVNGNKGGNWDAMARPNRTFQNDVEGASVQTMVRLANEADIDPWFLMPYTADERYIRNFAKYVHDNLEPGRVAHVELGNEIWNYAFPATQQALKEGEAAGLGSGFGAILHRYAEKTKTTMAIWGQEFADNPKRVVRIIATQNAQPWVVRETLGWKDTAKYVDALATAPYFYTKIDGRTMADAPAIFAELDKSIDDVIGLAAQHQAAAKTFGKRFIAYEGGQHLMSKDVKFLIELQRDPRMGTAYQKYLNAWKTKIGTRLVLYSSTTPSGTAGAWGMREYAGQPTSETPKLNTILAYLKTLI